MILVIGSKKSHKNNPGQIADHIKQSGNEVIQIYWEDIIFSIESGEVNVRLNDRSLLSYQPELVIALGWYEKIYRDVAYSLALYLEDHHIQFWNSEMLAQRSTTKLSTMVQLALAKVSVPNSIFALEPTEQLLTNLDFPKVMKAIAASRGKNNYLVQDVNDLRAKGINFSQGYLIQDYLPNDYDLRVICYGGEPSLVLKRISSDGSHLNNTSQGGFAEWIDINDLDQDVLTECKKICKIMKREMAGIDLIPDSSSPTGYSCLEVNAIPQLTSGKDVQKKLYHLAEYLNKRI